jgi:5-methyltetrahydropteroyltriglutamate--homocysteine methyltransferase
VGEWRKAQDVSSVPVKYTLPGPMTIVGTLANAFYENVKDLCTDLAPIVNRHVKDLVEAGCKHIQIDEPLFARKPQDALDYGIALLDKCFEGVDVSCHKSVHICCGYPGYLDQADYQKADRNAYLRIAKAIDDSTVDAVSIEDAHCHNDLKLLEEFKKTTVIFGVVQSACSRVETADEIEDRIREALDHIEPERLMIAPDCGLAFLPPPILKAKLENMCAAAERCRCKRQRLTAKEGLKVCPF